MAKPKKAKTEKSLSKEQLKDFRHAVAVLKRKGLTSQATKPRSQRPTRYMLAQVAKYKDVISGKAQVVKVSQKAKSDLKEKFRTKGNRVVVPNKPGEQVRFNKRTGELYANQTIGGKRYRKTFIGQTITGSKDQLEILRAKGYAFAVPFRHGSTGNITYRFYTDPNELIRDMAEYRNYSNWPKYLELFKETKSRKKKTGDIFDAVGTGLHFDEDGNPTGE